MNVYQKINEVKKTVKNFTKDGATEGAKAYKYTTGGNILAEIKEKMESIGLLLLPVGIETEGYTTYEYESKSGKKTNFVVSGIVSYRWVNIDEPSDYLEVKIPLYGMQDDISKAFGSGLTYTERYFLLKSLGVPTDDDDPDKKSEAIHITKPTKEAFESAKASVPHTDLKGGKKSKYIQIKELIEGTDFTFNQVREWTIKNTGQDIKINDLPDDYFTKLVEAIKDKLPKKSDQELYDNFSYEEAMKDNDLPF